MENILPLLSGITIVIVMAYIIKNAVIYTRNNWKTDVEELDLTIEEYLELFGWKYRANSSLSNNYVHSDYAQFMLKVSPDNVVTILKLNIPVMKFVCTDDFKCAVKIHLFVSEWKQY